MLWYLCLNLGKQKLARILLILHQILTSNSYTNLAPILSILAHVHACMQLASLIIVNTASSAGQYWMFSLAKCYLGFQC